MKWFKSVPKAFIHCLIIVVIFQTHRVSTEILNHIFSVNVTRGDNLSSDDKINLLLVTSKICQEQNYTEISAECVLLSQEDHNSCYIECVCKNITGSFIINEKKCSDERRLRQGMYISFCFNYNIHHVHFRILLLPYQ